MRIAIFQFNSSGDILANFSAIKRAVLQAAESNARLLVLHECVLCGYPPVEVEIDTIDFNALNIYTQEIKHLAKEHNIYIALGTIREHDRKRYNSMLLIDPNGETVGSYDKRALWGWDVDHFAKGDSLGIFEIDGVKIGLRICFEVRFPEYFRALFGAGVELCFVSFYDVSETDSIGRYDRIKAHLITRAVENVMTVISVNSSSKYQTAPTAVFDINGVVVEEAPKNEEHLLIYDYCKPEPDFGARGRIENSIQALNLQKGRTEP